MFEAENFVALGFVLFLGLLVYLGAHRRVIDGIDSRQARIKSELDEAVRLRQEAQAVLAEFERKGRDAEAEHRRAAARLEEIIAEALDAVAGPGPCIANAATHTRREVVVVDGEPAMVEVPGGAVVTFDPVPADHPVVVTDHSMHNGLIAARWNLGTRLTEKTGTRAAMRPGLNTYLLRRRKRRAEPAAHDASRLQLYASQMMPADSAIERLHSCKYVRSNGSLRFRAK